MLTLLRRIEALFCIITQLFLGRTRMKPIHRISFLTILAALILTGAISISAQSSDDFHRFEFSGGYTRASVGSNVAQRRTFTSTGGPGGTLDCTSSANVASYNGTGNYGDIVCGRQGFNGFDASAVFNLSRYIGIKGNVSGYFKSGTASIVYPTGSFAHDYRDRRYDFMAGLQVKDNSTTKRFKPYGHVLAGAERQSTHTVRTPSSTTLTTNIFDKQVTSFAMKFGGGLDVRASRHLDVRLIEVNYHPVFTKDTMIGISPATGATQQDVGRTAHNFTFGVGIAIH
jgi:hypothetical protein